MPRYRVLLANAVVLDVRDPREHPEIVAEWVKALTSASNAEKQMAEEENIGITTGEVDTQKSILDGMVSFRGETDEKGDLVGAATMHAGPIVGIGVPEPVLGGTKSFEETVVSIIRAFKETK